MSFQQDEAKRDLADVKYKAVDALFKALRSNGWDGMSRSDLTAIMDKANPQTPQAVYSVVLNLTGSNSGLEQGPGALKPDQVSSIRNSVASAIAYDASHEQDYFDTNHVNGSMDQVASGTFASTSSANAQAAMGGDADGDGIANIDDPNPFQDDRKPPKPGPGPSPVADTPVTHMFTLIKGDGPNTGDAVNLTGNGAAVYVLNNRGERFHVTETLANEMKAGGSWYEPEVRPQAEVDGMALRYTVDSTSNLGTINNPPTSGGFMLVKGDGAPNPDNNVLVGNGNAVYAVDAHGQEFHVTEAAFNAMQSDPAGPPAIATITQAAVDIVPSAGVMDAPAGAIVVTPENIVDAAAAAAAVVLSDPSTQMPAAPVVTPTSAPDPAPAATPAGPVYVTPADDALQVGDSTEATTDFKLIKGDGAPNPDNNVLVGNGNAVYAVNAAGQKFHVTGALYDKMVANGTWKEPEVMSQGAVDAMANGSSTSMTDMSQLRSINIGNGSEFRLIKGDGPNTGDVENLVGNGAAVYAVDAQGNRFHVTAELAAKMQADGTWREPEVMAQSEVDSLGEMKGHLTTFAQLNTATESDTYTAPKAPVLAAAPSGDALSGGIGTDPNAGGLIATVPPTTNYTQ